MRKDVQGMVLLLVGVMVLRLAIGDQFLFYVAEAMRVFLLISAAILVFLGGYALWRSWRDPDEEDIDDAAAVGIATASDDSADGDSAHTDGHGHDHHGGPRIAYLLLLPVLAVYVVAPSALGAFSAERQTTTSTAPPVDLQLPALAPGAEIPLRDYVVRAVWDEGRTLGQPVTMVGFVTPDPAGGWWLSRMSMACCAADAAASRIKVLNAPDFPADTWVRVTGSWVEGGGTQDPKAIPIIDVADVTPVERPRNPYE